MLDVRPDQLKIIRDILRLHVPAQRVVAFGSRAKWTAKEYSDLDLAIMGDVPIPSNILSMLREAFDESNLPFQVDVVDWATTKDNFRRIIEKEYVVVQEGKKKSGASEWVSTTLGNVLELKRGYDLPKTSRQNGLIPVISSSGASGTHSEIKAKGPGVVTGRYGTIGKVYFIREDFWPLNTTLYVKDFKGNDVRFISYFLQQIDFDSCSDKAAVPGVNRNHLHMVNVSIPPLPEQKAIAHVLGTLDDKIELNRKMNETLETMARALFRSWFVDFDPVHAKAEGRKPAGMDAATASLFPDSFEPSPLGPIPKGWSEKSFADTIDILSGGTPKTSVAEYWHGDIPWFSVTDTPTAGSVFVIDTEKKITPAGVENSATQIMPVGTTIITARGTVGNTALAGVPIAINQSCYGLRGKAEKRGFFTFFATRAAISTLQQRGHGSVFNTITRDTFAGVKVIAPPKVLVEAFDEKSSPLLDRIYVNLFETRTLTFIRNSLLPKLLSGDLRIKNAEQFAEAVL